MSSQTHPAFGSMLLAVTIEPEEVGRRIAAARTRKGWTQEVFARRASVSVSSVQRWEAGQLPPTREMFRLAPILGVLIQELVEENPPTDLLESLSTLVGRLEMAIARLEEEPPRGGRRASPE